jgi:hypothetical protein
MRGRESEDKPTYLAHCPSVFPPRACFACSQRAAVSVQTSQTSLDTSSPPVGKCTVPQTSHFISFSAYGSLTGILKHTVHKYTFATAFRSQRISIGRSRRSAYRAIHFNKYIIGLQRNTGSPMQDLLRPSKRQCGEYVTVFFENSS